MAMVYSLVRPLVGEHWILGVIENHQARQLTENELEAIAEKLNDRVDWKSRYNESMRIFESLTPMGSEFYHDPKACHIWVEQELRLAREAIRDRIVITNRSRLARWAYDRAVRKYRTAQRKSYIRKGRIKP